MTTELKYIIQCKYSYSDIWQTITRELSIEEVGKELNILNNNYKMLRVVEIKKEYKVVDISD